MSGRVQQWAGFSRENACVNTSMLAERFHKRLKHELPDAKPNMRIDRLVDVLITLSEEIEEDRNIMMKRTLMSGRYRLRQQHIQHEQATRWFRGRQNDVQMIADGIWQVAEGGALHRVVQEDCTCDHLLNNHCMKGNCGACGYDFRCECEKNIRSGVACLHVHACLQYAPGGGKLTRQREVEELQVHDVDIRKEEAQSGLDSNRDIIYAVLRHNMIIMAKIPDSAVKAYLEEVLGSMKSLKDKSDEFLRSNTPSKEPLQLVRRRELPACGRIREEPPIRKLLPRSALKKKTDARSLPELPPFSLDDLSVCAVCFKRDPEMPTDKENTSWLKCNVCARWVHEDCCSEGSKCPFDDGTFCCFVLHDS
ncbi:unnamed protein product [Heligmosomoides polygyrus]|uniref:Phorbol-ester/DAG-type domain-containing protein n=1 Tax=Heligmosomoides polygyrus TaxID=6339 RepID=A0A183F852_HELPZ|nr:unnamed protein product [Heligmosomoides polygyrus]